jgi:hypothetical protein
MIESWHEAVATAEDGERLLLIDTDTMVLRPLDGIWGAWHDMTITDARKMFAFSTGVVAVTVSDAVRDFFGTWRDAQRRLLLDDPASMTWREKYGGINQAALGMVMGDALLRIRRLPTIEWNCEHSWWEEATDPRIVHLCGRLRELIFAQPGTSIPAELHRWVDLWHNLEQEAAA